MDEFVNVRALAIDEANALTSPNESLPLTQTKRRGLRTAQTQPGYQAAVERGNVWGVCSQTGITSQAGLSLTTPGLTIYNPAGSGYTGVLWYAAGIFAVANAAAATVWLAANTNTTAAAVTGTATTAHRNLKLGSAANPTALQFLLAATLPAAPVGIDILGIGLTGAITVAPNATTHDKWYDGGILIKPGTAISLQTSTASGTSGFWSSYIIEEVIGS